MHNYFVFDTLDVSELNKLVFSDTQDKMNEELESFAEQFENGSVSAESLAKTYAALTSCHSKISKHKNIAIDQEITQSLLNTQELLDQALSRFDIKRSNNDIQEKQNAYLNEKQKRKKIMLDELRKESDRLDEYYTNKTRESIYKNLVGTQWISNVFEAAASGNLDYLKNNVKNLNDKNERGWTPLHFAARFGQLETVEFLKKNKVNLSEVNSEGKTAHQLATLWGNEEIAKLLQESAPTVNLFPDNHTAVFAGSPLNRYGWARTDQEFLSKLSKSPKSKYVVLSGQQALYDQSGSIHYVDYEKVAFIVDKVYTSDGFNKNNSEIILVFLGIDESQGKGEDGVAFWALDLTPKGLFENELQKLVKEFESGTLAFCPTLPRAFTMEKSESAILAQAAAMIDWNARNIFCSACDAVVITCIIHPNGDKILLGRQKRWPKKMYSCIAGFIEAAESLEEAIRREAYEETGIIVNRVAYHSSQPWPFPNSLMLGFHAEAVSTDISFADDELESARWFTRSEVIAAAKGNENATFSLPSKGSLAYTLVNSWLNDKKWQNKL
ncbi:hypothetical protein G6F29_007656 [Rhizopus arrhizus]|uniref:NAD(+) diphosphatase n=1 Tax=Rhizopus oryzae TaxID=64495 RepID=A0A9P6X0S0_RHIOR|nr:hypothetical protein G6F24_004559 [Rhizopus arrhizus]KAG1410965.1 hypothetical protein G6F58_008824 [Rhizopus delemar]KAG0788407.1 hypothetical protein G6F22_007016 [Rhizopus arrhizus]KAG0792520.1 hypothetical protein G6F21_004298 [Rhizopus arrhizus]KAG0810345.1 hypothetical protein G6F20_008037 [Rhizopus arrhizus]